MNHYLLRVTDPAIFGAPVWLCTCGHRAFTATQHRHHAEGKK